MTCDLFPRSPQEGRRPCQPGAESFLVGAGIREAWSLLSLACKTSNLPESVSIWQHLKVSRLSLICPLL